MQYEMKTSECGVQANTLGKLKSNKKKQQRDAIKLNEWFFVGWYWLKSS